jgi:hypothetical protein
MTMGKNGVNIANFTLGRSGVGQDAIAISLPRPAHLEPWPS